MWNYERYQEMEKMEKEDWLSKIIEEDERLKSYQSMSPTERADLITKILSPGLVDFMYRKGYTPKSYNACYGGYGLSEEADLLYGFLKCHTSSPLIHLFSSQEDVDILPKLLTDRVKYEIITAKVCLFLGRRNNSSNAFKFVKTEFHEYFHCSDYDGKETVYFNDHEMKVLEATKILKENHNTAEEKLQEIQTIFDSYLSTHQLIIERKTAVTMFAEENKIH
jgi:hypothetical protein